MRDLLHEKTGDFKHWQLGFNARVGSPDELGVLHGLAECLKVPKDIPDLQQQVVKTMCGSLQNGSIAFLDIRSWNKLNPPERVLKWFLDSFWQCAVAQLTDVAEKRAGMKLVALLLVDNEIPEEALPAAHVRKVKNFENGKMLHMSLKKWSKEEIDDWLLAYADLPPDGITDLSDRIQELAQTPVLVCELLKKELCK